MKDLQFTTAGSITAVSTRSGALIGHLVARKNGDTTIIGPGDTMGATYTSEAVALQRLLATSGPTRSEREIEMGG